MNNQNPNPQYNQNPNPQYSQNPNPQYRHNPNSQYRQNSNFNLQNLNLKNVNLKNRSMLYIINAIAGAVLSIAVIVLWFMKGITVSAKALWMTYSEGVSFAGISNGGLTGAVIFFHILGIASLLCAWILPSLLPKLKEKVKPWFISAVSVVTALFDIVLVFILIGQKSHYSSVSYYSLATASVSFSILGWLFFLCVIGFIYAAVTNTVLDLKESKVTAATIGSAFSNITRDVGNFAKKLGNQQNSAQNGYPQGGYQQNGYQQNNYPQNGYPQNGYQQNNYQQNGYQQNNYPQNGDPQNGYQQGGSNNPDNTQQQV